MDIVQSLMPQWWGAETWCLIAALLGTVYFKLKFSFANRRLKNVREILELEKGRNRKLVRANRDLEAMNRVLLSRNRELERSQRLVSGETAPISPQLLEKEDQ